MSRKTSQSLCSFQTAYINCSVFKSSRYIVTTEKFLALISSIDLIHVLVSQESKEVIKCDGTRNRGQVCLF